MTVTPEAVDEPATGVTPWVLLLVSDVARRRALRQEWENAGFAVEVASSAKDALECLNVMTPSLVVIEDRLFRPLPR